MGINRKLLAAVVMKFIIVIEDDRCYDKILENLFFLIAACSKNRLEVPDHRRALDRNDFNGFLIGSSQTIW